MKGIITEMKFYCNYRQSRKSNSYKDSETIAFIAACYMIMNFRCITSWHHLTENRGSLDISNECSANKLQDLIF